MELLLPIPYIYENLCYHLKRLNMKKSDLIQSRFINYTRTREILNSCKDKYRTSA